mmetsp:Transcript_23308/g.68454  ORF Transcript_23308/g.68454 Transcript_23308/m.68454 type:complete len:201 (+) Transcript_23308:155-757(+)
MSTRAATSTASASPAASLSSRAARRATSGRCARSSRARRSATSATRRLRRSRTRSARSETTRTSLSIASRGPRSCSSRSSSGARRQTSWTLPRATRRATRPPTAARRVPPLQRLRRRQRWLSRGQRARRRRISRGVCLRLSSKQTCAGCSQWKRCGRSASRRPPSCWASSSRQTRRASPTSSSARGPLTRTRPSSSRRCA